MRPPDHERPSIRGVTDLRFTAASPADQARGLLYFAEATHGLLRVVFTVRVTRDGRTILSFPTRHDRHGRQHAIVRPVNDAALRVIEAEVFVALRIKAEGAAT